jgi:hypothetical protein
MFGGSLIRNQVKRGSIVLGLKVKDHSELAREQINSDTDTLSRILKNLGAAGHSVLFVDCSEVGSKFRQGNGGMMSPSAQFENAGGRRQVGEQPNTAA